MTWRWRAVPKSFRARSERRAQPAGIMSDPGEPRVAADAIQGDGSQDRREEEQAAEFGRERPRAQVELPDIGDRRYRWTRAGRSLVIGPARQPSEPSSLRTRT